MKRLRWLFRAGRVLSAFLLLATFLVGEVADGRHHLSAHGCAGDSPGRDDNCTCASLHAAPFASDAVTQVTPVECERQFTPIAEVLAPIARTTRGAAPRAPP